MVNIPNRICTPTSKHFLLLSTQHLEILTDCGLMVSSSVFPTISRDVKAHRLADKS